MEYFELILTFQIFFFFFYLYHWFLRSNICILEPKSDRIVFTTKISFGEIKKIFGSDWLDLVSFFTRCMELKLKIERSGPNPNRCLRQPKTYIVSLGIWNSPWSQSVKINFCSSCMYLKATCNSVLKVQM